VSASSGVDDSPCGSGAEAAVLLPCSCALRRSSPWKQRLAGAVQGRRAQPWLIRLTHWLNVPLLVLMAGSGLQIFAAYPALGPRGARYGWYPWDGVLPPTWAQFGGWLAGGRHWHFALGWFLVLNGSSISATCSPRRVAATEFSPAP